MMNDVTALLGLHRTLSQMIREAVAAHGEAIVQSTEVKTMRAVKKDVLGLVSTFVNLAEDARFVAANFIPPLLDPVLADYVTSPAPARDEEPGDVHDPGYFYARMLGLSTRRLKSQRAE